MFQCHWDEAAAAFAKAVELYPGSFAAPRDLGGTYEQLNRADDAARAYEAAITLRDQGDLRATPSAATMTVGASQEVSAD